MMDLAKLRRARNKRYEEERPSKGILDVIEADYTVRYEIIKAGFNRIETLFSREEWVDILTKSRNSHESDIRRLKNKTLKNNILKS